MTAQFIRTDRLTSPRLLGLYALMLHLALQVFGGHEMARQTGAPTGGGLFDIYCFNSPVSRKDPSIPGRKTEAGSCTVCHVHCTGAAMAPALNALLLIFSMRRFAGPLSWRVPAPPYPPRPGGARGPPRLGVAIEMPLPVWPRPQAQTSAFSSASA